MANPLYALGDTVYLKESAALGSLEAVRIGGMMKGSTGWLYSIQTASPSPLGSTFYGDKRSLTNGALLYFSESEFVSQCAALEIVEANLLRAYNTVHAQRIALCESNPTG